MKRRDSEGTDFTFFNTEAWERLRFALSAYQAQTRQWDTPAAASQQDDAGNASSGDVSPTVEELVRRRAKRAYAEADQRAVAIRQTIEVGVTASVDKTRNRPPPRRPSLA